MPAPWFHDGTSMIDKSALLLVEDEPAIRQPLHKLLEREGFRVVSVPGALDARKAIAAEDFDLAVLDIMMPGEDGLSLGRWIRASSNLPVLFLSAKGDDIDRIVGLEIGADDYLPKPFNPRELVARIKAILRRSDPALPGRPQAALRFENFTIDPERRTVTRDGEALALTGGEFRLLLALAQRSGRTLAREHLLHLTQGREPEAFDRSVDNMVMRLRRKLGPEGARLISTDYGRGYRLVAKVTVA